MFVSDKLIGLFQVAKDTVDTLRTEAAAAHAEISALRQELAGLRATNEWMRHKINGLEVERAALFNRAFNTNIPAPEIVAAPTDAIKQTLTNLNFDHIDDETARKLGIESLLS